MTERMMYEFIKEAMSDNSEVVEFCDKKIAALDKKKEYVKARAEKKKALGDPLIDVINEILNSAEEPMTLADICALIEGEDVTASKVVYRLNSLIKDKVVEKSDVTIDVDGKKFKRKAYRKI